VAVVGQPIHELERGPARGKSHQFGNALQGRDVVVAGVVGTQSDQVFVIAVGVSHGVVLSGK
jgi:hypothetical protein